MVHAYSTKNKEKIHKVGFSVGGIFRGIMDSEIQNSGLIKRIILYVVKNEAGKYPASFELLYFQRLFTNLSRR